MATKRIHKKTGRPPKSKDTNVLPATVDGRPRIVLSESEKTQLQTYARLGLPMDAIAEIMHIGERTLYRRLNEEPELLALYKVAKHQANAAVASYLFDSCKPVTERVALRERDGSVVKDADGQVVFETKVVRPGSVEAMKFWLKTQAGWKDDVTVNLKDERKLPMELAKLSDNDQQELLRILAVLETPNGD